MFKLKKFHKTDPNAKKILTVSKNQLKKVKDHGHFDGKNITHFDDDIKPISDEEFRRKKYEKSAKK